MNRKHGIGAVTGGANNWQPRRATSWQAERRDGKLLPMQQPKRSLFALWRGK